MGHCENDCVVVAMTAAAAVGGPLATRVRDAWLVPGARSRWMIFVAEDGDVDHAADLISYGRFEEKSPPWLVAERDFLSFLGLLGGRGFGNAALTSRFRLCSMIGCMIDALIGR